MNLNYKFLVFPISGIILIFLAVFSHYFGNYEIKSHVVKNLQLSPNSTSYKAFLNPENFQFRKFYFFDVINAEAVENGTEKPILIERGPYAYQEKGSLEYNEFVDENYFKFRPVGSLIFFPEYSIGSEFDEVTVANIPAINMVEKMGKMNITAVEKLMNDLIKLTKSKLFVRKTVKELLSGYEDPLLKLVHTMFPQLVPTAQFSLLLKAKNATSFQNFTIMTGKDDINNLGKIKLWNDLETLDFWGNDYTNMINGTNGAFVHPYLTENEILYIFNSAACRSLNFEFLKESTYNGVTVYQFHLPKNIFGNSTNNPNNYGFCEKDVCLGNGVLNISLCSSGSPVFISQPHFLNADQKFYNSFEGLQPNEKIHDFVIQCEPTFGSVIKRNMRFQINFFIQKNEAIELVKNIHPVLFPVAWYDDEMDNSNDVIGKLKDVEKLEKLVKFSILVFGFFGIFLTIISTIFITNHVRKQRKINPEEASENPSEDTESTKLLSDDPSIN